jgi:hypothetical protein
MSTGGDENLQIALTLDAGAAAPAVAGAVTMFRAIVDTLRDAHKESDDLAAATTRVRDSLRDIRALSGAGPVSDEFLRTHLQFIRDTGLTQTQAHDFIEQFLGEAEASRGKMASPEEFSRLQNVGAQYGAALGGDIGSHAKILGRLVGIGPQGQTAEDVMGQFAEVTRIMNYGSGELSLAMKSLSNAAAFTLQEGGTGPVGSARNLAVLGMGASRLGSESTIDTTIMQFMRATTGAGTEKWREFLRGDVAGGGLGVKEGTKIEEAMIPLFRAMEKVANIPALTGTREDQARQAQAIAAGGTQQGKDLDTWLREQGMTSMEERRSVIGMFSQRQTMTEMLGAAPEATGATAADVVAKVRASRSGQQALADAALMATETEVGMEHEPLRRYLTLARERLTAERAPGFAGVPTNVFERMAGGMIGTDPQERMIFERAQQIAEEKLNQRFSRPEPGVLAQSVGDISMIAPGATAALLRMVAPNLGAQLMGQVGQTRESVTGWVARQQGLGVDAGTFMSEIAKAEGLRQSGGYDENTYIWTGRGRTTVGEFEKSERASGRSQAEIAKKIADALQRGTVRPLVSPSTGKTPNR